MKDVAEAAGVAIGTVSRVVNGKQVGREYEEKVQEAIRKLNYKVNSYAQGLKSAKTYTAAVILPNTFHPHYGKLAFYLNEALHEESYRMLLCCTDFDPGREQDYIEMAQQNKVDGIIGLTYNPNLIIPEDVPFVSIDRAFSKDVPCVSCDNFMGGQLAAEKLADLGCKKVAFLRQGSRLDNEPNKRKAGFENGCFLRGLSYDIKMIDDGVPISVFGDFLYEHFRDGKLDYDGIFCVTDRLAYEIRIILEQFGLRVPEDVQIIGFDGVLNFGDKDPVCSTIAQPLKEIAEVCVEYLLHDNRHYHVQFTNLPVSYVPGSTTKDAPALCYWNPPASIASEKDRGSSESRRDAEDL